MPPPAARAEARRARLAERIADHVLAEGLAGSGLRAMAEAAGTSDRMLLYYFRDKAEVIDAALDALAARLTAQLAAAAAPAPLAPAALRPRLLAIALAPEVAPFMRLWLEIAAGAARGDPALVAAGARIGRGFLDWIAAQLAAPTPEAARAEAARLLALIEGALLLRAVGLEAETLPALLSPPGDP